MQVCSPSMTTPLGAAATPAVPLHCTVVAGPSVPLDGEEALSAPAAASRPAIGRAVAIRLFIHKPPETMRRRAGRRHALRSKLGHFTTADPKRMPDRPL